MPAALSELTAVEQTGPDEFVSKALPMRLGNILPIAYGGCTIAVAVSAACATVTNPNVHLYSVLGHFHGPASTERKLHAVVHRTRDTRSFSTRRVEIKQAVGGEGGELRTCLEVLLDFHAAEPSSLEYSAPPSESYPPPELCPVFDADYMSALEERGVATEAQTQICVMAFGELRNFFTTRACPNGVAAQNAWGVLKELKTSQEGRGPTEQTSAEWQQPVSTDGEGKPGTFDTAAENLAALAFLMDGSIAFLPLTHGHMFFDDVTACSTLDFALRIYQPNLSMNGWTLRERKVSRAGNGRTYSEGRLWDANGNLIASNSQQSILRLKEGVKPNL